ncbi:MAG: elongation factor G [Armatimonadota bacterium]|nr:elongation factor G [Armatimonadota bacterium]MDR7421166.1 elongation factor G [Armatimonadota bacterium]MDR7457263.1 elongation factor G [Armatimonadota bacterium]MDR7496088.1 elongation factor G [Armatimonadota bacterium]MDR7511429.1 elongation factor G [Armatimonadota bacterium]
MGLKRYGPEQIRNVAVAGHGGVGKTSLVEAMLFVTGAIDRLGRVDDGTTTTDFDPEEIRRKHTINASLAPVEWDGVKINLIDTPGYPDFVGEVVGALRVCEGVVVVTDARAGVEVQTEYVWARAEDRDLPRLVVVNRLDRENASFDETVEMLRRRFGTRVVPVHLPVGAEAALAGVVDLLTMKAHLVKDGKETVEDIPAALRETAQAARERLMEVAAESDDALVEQYLEAGSLSDEELARGLVAGVRSGRVVPVLAAAAGRLVGARQLLAAITRLLPSPADRGPVAGTHPRNAAEVRVSPDERGPLAALVFKTMADPYVGRLSYFRVFGGVLVSDSQVYNATRDKNERLGQLYILRGKHQEATPQVGPGDIGAVAKLAETGTGDTLCSKDAPVRLEPVAFPQPAISMAIEPKSKADEDKMGNALHRLAEEDPTFTVRRDAELKQTVISGMGESHLEIMADRLRRKFGVDVTLAPPRVPYRETVKGKAQGQGRHVKQSGGRGQYGVCFLEVEPLPRGAGFEFVDKIYGGAIPNQFIPSVEKGVRKALEEGILAGYPVVDIRVTLVDGKYHDVDSSDIAFQLAGALGLKEAATKAGLVLLEPILNIEVRVPEEQMGDIIGDLNSKRARIAGMEPQGDGTTLVRAQVPQGEVLRYASDLRSLTGGRGSFTTSFSHYEPVPAHVADRLVAEAKRQKQEAEGSRA